PRGQKVNLLKRLLRPEHPGVEVRSVDGFQGGEKEAIVLSLVRSNPGQRAQRAGKQAKATGLPRVASPLTVVSRPV
ncbi:unnamed protein product, partial [Hapterophycus canaliculatus]